MITPVFENKSNKYIFTWTEFVCEVGRMHVDHDRTSCQLIFTNSNDNIHILRTRLNIETNTSRIKLAKDLTERYPVKDLEWTDAVEYIAEKTMRELEHGEPVITLRSTDEISPLDYLIYPIVPLGKPTAIFGDPGAGKSQIAVLCNIITALPWSDNPLKLGAPKNPTKLLFLDYEADRDDINRQLNALTNGMELGYCEIEYRRCSLKVADDIEGIRNHLDEKNIGGLIIDSVSLAAGGDLNRMDIATDYIRALRSLGSITSISMAHTSKDRESKNKTILGSVLFEAGFRSVWEIRANEGENYLDIALFHRKSNLSKKFHDIGFRITYTDTGNLITWLNPKSVPEFIERMSLKTRLIEYLKDSGKTTIRTIASDLNESEASVRSRLNEGKGKIFFRFENNTKVENKMVDEWGLLMKM